MLSPNACFPTAHVDQMALPSEDAARADTPLLVHLRLSAKELLEIMKVGTMSTVFHDSVILAAMAFSGQYTDRE